MPNETTLRVMFKETRTADVAIPLTDEMLRIYPPSTHNEEAKLNGLLREVIVALGHNERGPGCEVVYWEETDANQN